MLLSAAVAGRDQPWPEILLLPPKLRSSWFSKTRGLCWFWILDGSGQTGA